MAHDGTDATGRRAQRARPRPLVGAVPSTLTAVAVLGLAAALLFAALVVVVRDSGDGSDGTDAAARAVSESPPAPAPEVDLGPASDDPQTGSAEDGDPDGDAAVLGVTEERAREREVASTDGGSFFTYTADPNDAVAGSSTVVVAGEERVSLVVVGNVEGDRVRVDATVENRTAGSVVFEDGLTVGVTILRGGSEWRSVTLADPSVRELAPGARAVVTTHVTLDEHGEYELRGEVAFSRPS